LKEYVLYAGVNGTGKSTFYNIHDKKLTNRVNPDEILVQMRAEANSDNNELAAMRKSIMLVNDFLKRGESFCQETTLAGKTVFRTIAAARSNGYKIIMHYVGVENADIAVSRVRERVKRGGHNIPEADIRRRYDISLAHFKKAVDLCDEVTVYDNTVLLKRIAFFENSVLIKRDDDGVLWFQKLFPN
jgi:predicted ABC-type ATPase